MGSSRAGRSSGEREVVFQAGHGVEGLRPRFRKPSTPVEWAIYRCPIVGDVTTEERASPVTGSYYSRPSQVSCGICATTHVARLISGLRCSWSASLVRSQFFFQGRHRADGRQVVGSQWRAYPVDGALIIFGSIRRRRMRYPATCAGRCSIPMASPPTGGARSACRTRSG